MSLSLGLAIFRWTVPRKELHWNLQLSLETWLKKKLARERETSDFQECAAHMHA